MSVRAGGATAAGCWWSSRSTSASTVEQAQVALGDAASTEAALAAALLQALERYQGADAAADAGSALTQARAAARYADLLASHVESSSLALQQLRAAATAEPVATPAAAAALLAERDRVATHGLSLQQSLALDRIGVTGAEQDTVRRRLAQLPIVPDPTAALTSAVDGLLAERSATRAALQQLVVDLGGMISTIATDPNISGASLEADAGGPYSGLVGSPLTLVGGPVAGTHAWDLDGDGDFDDATGPAPTVTPAGPRHGLVGLQVTDANGHLDVDYARYDIADPNSAPTLTVTPPTGTEVRTGEPVPADGLGDGDTGPADAKLGVAGQVLLRAERSGTGDGRVYRVGFSATDGRGGSCTGTVLVGVPKAQAPSKPPVDSGPSFSSFG